MIDMLPDENNRVSVDPKYQDNLGNMRPVISYTPPEYTMRGAAYARQLARLVFQRLGAADYTAYDPEDYGYITYEGEGYAIRGGNHLAGTHIMGCCADHRWSTKISAHGSTRIFISWAAAACRRSAPRTSPLRLRPSVIGRPKQFLR